jgi:hypothetical protein
VDTVVDTVVMDTAVDTTAAAMNIAVLMEGLTTAAPTNIAEPVVTPMMIGMNIATAATPMMIGMNIAMVATLMMIAMNTEVTATGTNHD